MSEDPLYIGDYLDPHVRQGRYMRELDEEVMKRQSRQIGAIGVALIILYCIIVPPYRAMQNLFIIDKVKIVELNPHIRQDPNVKWAEGERGIYAVLHSVDAANEWLVENGYSKRQILTSHPENRWRSNDPDAYWKLFPVNGQANSPQESVVDFVIDYGNGQPRYAAFHYKNEDAPWDLSRLPDAVLPPTWKDGRPTEDISYASCAFSLGVYSMHDFITIKDRITAEWPAASFDRKYEEEDRKRYYKEKDVMEANEDQRLRREAEEALR